jgi:mono/diheme cytochrome c family protein
MFRNSTALCLFLLLVTAGLSQEKKESVPAQAPANLVIPQEEMKRENPIKPTEGSIADGKKLFGYQCAMCHGEKGDGKTELAETMKLKMKDWSSPDTLKDFTDGTLNYVIEKGKGPMPGQEGRMKAEQKWNLVNYIRSLAKKPAEAKPAAPPKPE